MQNKFHPYHKPYFPRCSRCSYSVPKTFQVIFFEKQVYFHRSVCDYVSVYKCCILLLSVLKIFIYQSIYTSSYFLTLDKDTLELMHQVSSCFPLFLLEVILQKVFTKFSKHELVICPGWMHETSARGWCTGKTQRDPMEREVGGGIRMGNTCKSVADSCKCMANTTTILQSNQPPSNRNKWKKIFF